MKKMLIAFGLSSLVLPGLGQLYNRQKLKGTLLVSFSIFIFLVFNIFIALHINPDIVNGTLQENFRIIQDNVSRFRSEYPKPFEYYGLIFLVLWTYASIDALVYAYMIQKKEQNREKTE